MSENKISFHTEDICLPEINKQYFISIIVKIITDNKMKAGEIAIIFTSDNYLQKINKKYLNRDYYTDTITFNYTENEEVAGDAFISLHRVEENAKKYNVEFSNELHRIVIHSILHLLGYDDQNKEDKDLMTSMENKYLEIAGFIS